MRHQQRQTSALAALKTCGRRSSTSQVIQVGASLHCVSFNDHFSLLKKDSAVESTPPPEDRALSVTRADVRKIQLRVNINKAAGPDNIPGLKTCQSASWYHYWYLQHVTLSGTVPTCFKTALYLKESAVSTVNDYHPMALSPTLMKYFEKLVLRHIKDNIPANLDPQLRQLRVL